ncbi:GerMN domain-containing protein [Sedimentibacter hydroxybenzoicus DSM 7310]|uniref:GerMN domain-containing protein n=1 Tax=Sedimentibacter hydroxybenzoicus DSM 7310 TaxID=1123245 RepID=A0A974BL19_SEDHY|nr:GerMN domain-containing protein [Sedimentibacter hydroxybenzoicus]NYB75154.1 GerMN domain-containing protein [Sedimentibacter hydroxybenzoicus DSM 7310]
MKIFNNIIILSLIGLFSSTYLFNLAPIDYRGTIEIETPEEINDLKLITEEYNLLNPESITIHHQSDNEVVTKSVSNSIFTVDIYKENSLIRKGVEKLESVSPSVNMSIIVNKNNPIVTSLDISQESLGLEDGTYSFVFNSNLIANSDNSSISVNVTYDTAGTYYPAKTQAPTGTKGLTLYFATENSDALIPVTRFVVEDKSITRMAIEQLQNGPLSSKMRTVIKDVTNTTYNNGNVVIDIPSSYTAYNEGSAGSSLAYESFVKTIFDVDRYWPIHSITFTVDRKKVDTYFHERSGEAINLLPNIERNYLLYMAYKIDGRYYLFDYQIDTQSSGILASDTVEIQAQKLFDVYKDIKLSYGVSPIPKNVVLNDVTKQGTIITLNFNDSFLSAYKDREDLKQMMIESLAYTFTTLPHTDGIIISVNGEDKTGVIYPPEFINPEAIE